MIQIQTQEELKQEIDSKEPILIYFSGKLQCLQKF